MTNVATVVAVVLDTTYLIGGGGGSVSTLHRVVCWQCLGAGSLPADIYEVFSVRFKGSSRALLVSIVGMKSKNWKVRL